MTGKLARHPAIERHLARLLGCGTALACSVVAAGLLLPWFGSFAPSNMGPRLVTIGIALFLALPVLRLAVMAWAFARERDYRFAAITGLVMAVIAASAAFGILSGTHGG